MATNLPPELLRQLLAQATGGQGVLYQQGAPDNAWSYTRQQNGSTGGMDGIPSGPFQTHLYRNRDDGQYDVFGEDGSFQGTEKKASTTKDWAQFIAASLAGYFGMNALAEAGLGGTVGASGAGVMTAAEQVAMMAANGMTDAQIAAALGSEAASAAGLTASQVSGTAGAAGGAIKTMAGLPELGQALPMLETMGPLTGGMTPAQIAAIGAGTTIPAALSGGGNALASGGFWDKITNATAGDWLRFGGPILGAGIGAYALDKATDAQRDSVKESNALLKDMYDQNVARNEPFVTGGVKGFYDLLDKLGISGNTGAAGYGSMNRTTSPQDVLKTPGYQFGMDQGLKAQGQKLNAQGMSYSGPAIKAATRYGTDYATTKFNDAFNRDETSKGNEYNRLMGVSQMGQNAANFTANTGSQYAQQVGQNLQGAGNAAAANYMGMGNLLGGAINQGVSSYQNKDMNDAWLAYVRSLTKPPGS